MLGAALALFLFGIVFVATAQAQLRGGSGDVRVNVEWHEDVDLDLYVTDPCGEVLGFGESRRRSCDGFVGEWDYDDTGDGHRDDNPNAENIVWSNGAAVGGYTVDVNYYSGTVAANYTVRIFYGDRSETHSGQIGPNSDGRQRVAQFVADETVNASTLTLSARPVSIAEDAGTSAITVTGELDRAAISNTVVTVTVGAQGDSAEEGTDYASVSDLTLTIPEGQTSATTTFALTPTDDDVAENDEALSISGRDPSDTDQLPLTVTGTTITIEDDDERVPPSTMVTLTAGPLSVDEAAGSTTVTVTGTLDGAPRSTATTVTVTVGAQDDSATEGTDYGTIADFPLTIQAGETTGSATFTFTPINDDVDEDDEVISLSGTTDAVGLSVAGTELTIADEHTPGVELSVSTVAVVEDQSSTYAVRLSARPDQNVAVTPRSDNPHIVFQPPSLVFDIGNWAAPQDISFEIAAENQQAAVTIEHSVSGYGEVTEGGVVTVIVAQPSVDPEQQTVHRTVAAVAAATVSNVTSNIGARFSAPTGSATLSLAGTPVAFGPTGSKSLEPVRLHGGYDDPDGDRRQARRGTMTGGDLLRSSSFEITLGASQGDKAPMSDASNRLTVWGRGDFQLFESGGGLKSGYDGDLLAGYLGADLAMDGGWLAGLAISRIAAEADYTLGRAGGGGTLEAELTNVHPYVRVAIGAKTEAWAILGLGTGEITNVTQQTTSKTDMSMKMVSAGGRHGIASGGGVDLAILADGSSAVVETDAGVQAIDGISANVWRVRLGAEASYTIDWDDGSALTSFLEVAGRNDGGDSARGVGLEISPGLAFSHPESGLAVEARGRVLALHSADNHREYGASITVSKAPSAGGLGLSMAIIPTLGTPDGTLNAASAPLFPAEAADRLSDSLSLNSRLAYAVAVGKGVLAPFVDFSLRDSDSHRIRIGTRYSLGPSVELELSGDRHGGASGSSEHGVQFSGRIRF